MRHTKILKQTKQGFTLIEVVLVLAIGGLVFLLAFLAFNQVAINRRDNQRRGDANRLLAELQNYMSDKGSLPPISSSSRATNLICDGSSQTAVYNQFIQTYMCAPDFIDPRGEPYTMVAHSTALENELGKRYIQYTVGTGANRLACDSVTPLKCLLD